MPNKHNIKRAFLARVNQTWCLWWDSNPHDIATTGF